MAERYALVQLAALLLHGQFVSQHHHHHHHHQQQHSHSKQVQHQIGASFKPLVAGRSVLQVTAFSSRIRDGGFVRH
jgi:hypothetical protein